MGKILAITFYSVHTGKKIFKGCRKNQQLEVSYRALRLCNWVCTHSSSTQGGKFLNIFLICIYANIHKPIFISIIFCLRCCKDQRRPILWCTQQSSLTMVFDHNNSLWRWSLTIIIFSWTHDALFNCTFTQFLKLLFSKFCQKASWDKINFN